MPIERENINLWIPYFSVESIFVYIYKLVQEHHICDKSADDAVCGQNSENIYCTTTTTLYSSPSFVNNGVDGLLMF